MRERPDGVAGGVTDGPTGNLTDDPTNDLTHGLRGRPGAATAPGAVAPGSLRAWQAALRPRSMVLALGPVAVGAALALAQPGTADPLAAAGLVLAAAVAALLMQVVTNLQNDVGYTLRGAERQGGRHGLPRATAQGWLSVRAVQGALLAAALLATALGLWLVVLRGWPVLAIGGAALLAAWAYMGGPRPIAYTPLGEATAFAFFGPVAVAGTAWLLTGAVPPAAWPAGVAAGGWAAAALAINNHRDVAHDRAVGRRTFAVCWGPRASARGLALAGWLPFACLPLVAALSGRWLALLPLLLLPMAGRQWQAFSRAVQAPPGGGDLNRVLFGTFRLGWLFDGLLALGIGWPVAGLPIAVSAWTWALPAG